MTGNPFVDVLLAALVSLLVGLIADGQAAWVAFLVLCILILLRYAGSLGWSKFRGRE